MIFSFKFLIFLIFLVNKNQCNEQKKLIIKWVLNDTLPSIESPIELERLKKNKTKNQECIWNKLSENKHIGEDDDGFMYKITNSQCSLLIRSLNLSTLSQLDYYKAVGDDEIVYVLAYLKSFEVIKKETSLNSQEYTCQAVVTLPDLHNFNGNIEEALDENVIIDTNVSEKVKVNRQKSKMRIFFDKILKTLYRTKREDLIKNVLDYTISSEAVEVYKGENSKTVFKCQLKLKDGKDEKNDLLVGPIDLSEELGYGTNKYEADNKGTHLRFNFYWFIIFIKLF
jgi:hypothetical protein